MLWLKALHVVFVVTWFAGLFYLPRLYVYHAVTTDAPGLARFVVMERRLLRAIINPAIVVSWVTGLWLAFEAGFFRSGWLHVKLLLVILLSGAHGLFVRWVRDFAEDRNTHSHRFYRVVNEVPTLLMIGIVILVIVKPF